MASIEENTSSLGLRWPIFDSARPLVEKCVKRTNWEAMCDIASRSNNGQRCWVLPDITSGGSNLARLLKFEDGTLWVARVRMRDEDEYPSDGLLKAEVDTLAILKARSKAPVPQVFAFAVNDENPTGSAFMLTDFFPWNTGAEQSKKDPNERSFDVPREAFEPLCRSLAAAHVQIASVRLPKIGVVTRDADGNFGVGPIPNIGGPFDTATAFMQAWTAQMSTDMDLERMREWHPETFDEVVEGCLSWPSRLDKLAKGNKYFNDEGPFPIRHNEMELHNILVNKDFGVEAVIDWYGACALPWELVDCPGAVAMVKTRLSLGPHMLDEAGQHKDPELLDRLAAQRAYAEMVREAELEVGADHKLSDILADSDAQELASACHHFDEGMRGLYGRVAKYFEDKEST